MRDIWLAIRYDITRGGESNPLLGSFPRWAVFVFVLFFALLLQEKNTKGSNHNLIGDGISQRPQDLLKQESTHTHSSHILENTPTRVCFYHPSGKRVSRKLFSTKSWRFVLCFFSMRKLFSTVCWKKDLPLLTNCVFTNSSLKKIELTNNILKEKAKL